MYGYDGSCGWRRAIRCPIVSGGQWFGLASARQLPNPPRMNWIPSQPLQRVFRRNQARTIAFGFIYSMRSPRSKVASSPATREFTTDAIQVRRSFEQKKHSCRNCLSRRSIQMESPDGGGQPPLRQPIYITWLILPVVICLFQRLSHACLSICSCTAKLRMAH